MLSCVPVWQKTRMVTQGPQERRPSLTAQPGLTVPFLVLMRKHGTSRIWPSVTLAHVNTPNCLSLPAKAEARRRLWAYRTRNRKWTLTWTTTWSCAISREILRIGKRINLLSFQLDLLWCDQALDIPSRRRQERGHWQNRTMQIAPAHKRRSRRQLVCRQLWNLYGRTTVIPWITGRRLLSRLGNHTASHSIIRK